MDSNLDMRCERAQIQQAIEDLREIYPRWRFAFRCAGSYQIFEVPTREQQLAGGFSAILRPALLVE